MVKSGSDKYLEYVKFSNKLDIYHDLVDIFYK